MSGTVRTAKGDKMATNQSQYEEMCEVYERYNKGDLVPVVRCKDCKFYWKNSVMTDVPLCLASPREDAFCSDGERREDGTID